MNAHAFLKFDIDEFLDTVTDEERSLARRLIPIYSHLCHPDIEEVAINQPGEIWRRYRRPDSYGRLWVPFRDDRLSMAYLKNIAHQVANLQQVPHFGPHGMPVVYGTLPGGHRFGAGLGANIQHGLPDKYSPHGSIMMCVRQYTDDSKKKIGLVDYGIRPNQVVTPAIKSVFSRANDPNDSHAQLVNSLTRGDHILVSGATGSGKTTFVNNLISYIDDAKRIITIEDTRELKVHQPNRVHVMMSRTAQSNDMNYDAVRDLMIRVTPDVVLAGEISNKNAALIWELMTTGHGHFMTTIHASTVDEAVTTYINCIANSLAAAGNNNPIDRTELRAAMLAKLRIVQVERDHNGRRRVTKIL